jgi:hypothetical protein
MFESDPFIAHMERQKGVCDPLDMDEPDADEPTQAERLASPKCALLTAEDRLQQLLASAYEQYRRNLTSSSSVANTNLLLGALRRGGQL